MRLLHEGYLSKVENCSSFSNNNYSDKFVAAAADDVTSIITIILNTTYVQQILVPKVSLIISDRKPQKTD